MKFRTKLLRVMQLTTAILLITCLGVSARTSSQTVSYQAKNEKLETVFSVIKKQTGYGFFYKVADLKAAKTVSVDLRNTSLKDALEMILKNQPLRFSIEGNTVFITAKQPEIKGIVPNENAEAPPVGIDVTITVVAAENNQMLEGASVMIKGQSKGVATDVNGRAVLKDVDANATVVISYTGYAAQEIKLGGRNSVVIKLNVSTNELQEVVINKGYYTEKQKLSTSNISRVTAKDIEKQPVNNPLLALQGRVPGLVITQNNGLPGGALTVRILGQNSINNGNEPFYVVDGVPFTSLMLPTSGITLNILGGAQGPVNGSGNPLSYINPSDIESIEVLKDADATAIYGSRAANGAILITTKKGKVGQTKIDLNMQQGWGKVTRMLKMMNTQQYLEMRREAKKNDNASISSTDYDINGTWDTTRYTNWQDELIGGTAQYTNVSATASGGSTNSQYLVGGTYQRQTAVFPGNFADQKASFHFSINSSSNNQRFRLQLSGNYLFDKNVLPGGDLTATSINLAPNSPSLYNPDGSLNWALTSAGANTWTNPLDQTLNPYENIGSNVVGNAVLSYLILPALEIKSTFGYNRFETDEFSAGPLISRPPANRATAQRSSLFGNSLINSWIIEPQLNYQQKIGKGKLSVLLGSTFQKNVSSGKNVFGSGYNSDAVLRDILSASSVTILSTTESEYKYNAIFSRINYTIDNKYILNLTGRRDGSSRFGAENLFQNFGAIGAAWIFSEDQFFKTKLPFLSFGKLRSSYGTTGNDQIGDYKFMSLYNAISAGVPYQGIPSVEPTGLSNPALQWELKKSFDLGIQLSFLKDRLSMSANYSFNRSSNQLIGYTLPLTTGFGSVTSNFQATVKNRIWEIVLSSTNIKSKNFSWETSFNLTIPKNELTDFPGLSSSSYSSTLIIGQPLSIIRAYHLIGVDPASGIFSIADKGGNPTTTPTNDDKTVLVSTLPRYYGGFQNNFSYKGFQLDILFQFVNQIGQNFFGGSKSPGARRLNQPLSVLDRWQKPGDAGTIQRYSSGTSLGNQYEWARRSDAAYSDASFIRLKNLSLSYQLPERLYQKTGLTSCRIYVHAQNLFTITKFDGLDPETGQGITPSLPPLRIITAGVQLIF